MIGHLGGFYVFLLVFAEFQGTMGADFKVLGPTELPTFLTSSQVFKVTASQTIVLPCEVTHAGNFVLAWKRGIAVLSAGNVKVSPDPRISLIDGYSLEIKDAQPQDAGDYICQIGTMEPREITHTVEILVPPRIHYVSSNGRVEVKKGSPVRLECKASGNPVPAITWSRRNNLLPSGDQTLTVPVLTLDRVDRHQAGVYQCTAGNGVGDDVTEQIVLHVLYPPEISVERPVVHSGEGFEAQLVCIVHGESQPEVLWYRDTMQLDTTERRIMESRGSRHTLVIRKVHNSDFGNYTCVADNQLGKSRKSIMLTGKPNAVKFQSASQGQWRDSYNISWAVESLSPVEEYQLWFRKLQIDSTEQLRPLQHQSQQHSRRPSRKENDTYLSGGFGMRADSRFPFDWRSEWRDVILPAQPSQQPTQSMSYIIRGLEARAQYEAKVQARNRFGWSPVSEPFTFETTDKDSFLDRLATKTLYNHDNEIRDLGIRHYNSSCRPPVTILALLLSTIVFLLHYRT